MNIRIEELNDGWSRVSIEIHIKEPKRWFHSLGVNREVYIFINSIFIKDGKIYDKIGD